MVVLTAIFTTSLTQEDFAGANSPAKYDGVPVTQGVPVMMKYRILPGNMVSFGAGSNSYGGVRTALTFQIQPQARWSDASGSSKTGYVKCNYRLLYLDPNEVRQQVIKEGDTDYVKEVPVSANQFNFLPENTSQTATMFSYLAISLTPVNEHPEGWAVGHTTPVYSTKDTIVSIPVTIRTLATASGE